MNAKNILFLSVLASSLATTNAYAHSHLNCQAYAQSVVKQARKNIGLGCGFGGPVWSTDYNFHFNWCNQNTTQIHHLGEQENIRAAQMQQCISKVKTKDQYHRKKQKNCLAYAKKAIKLDAAIRKACPSNNAWPKKLKAHVDWCMSSNAGNAKLQNQLRAVKVNDCKSAKKSSVIKTFRHSGVYSKAIRKYLPVDACTKGVPSGYEGLTNACGKYTADLFCNQKGFIKAYKYPKKNYNNRNNLDGDLPSTFWIGSGKICTGKCTGFSSITCKGKL